MRDLNPTDAGPSFRFQIDRFPIQRSKEKVLRFSMKAVRRFAVMAAVVGVVSAFGAASASAVVFSPSGSTVHGGSITWKLNGGSPVTCTFSGGGNAFSSLIFGQQLGGACASNPPIMTGSYVIRALTTNSAELRAQSGVFQSPWGSNVTLSAVAVPFTNGNASTPSKLTFNNTLIGYHGGGTTNQVTWTGHLNVTTSTGGLVTIN